MLPTPGQLSSQLIQRETNKQANKGSVIMHPLFHLLFLLSLGHTSVSTLNNNFLSCLCPPLCCVLFMFIPKHLGCSRCLVNDYILYFSSRMILLLSFMPPFSSCFSHIKCSLTAPASKISVPDLQMPSPLCSFFWFFLCRP